MTREQTIAALDQKIHQVSQELVWLQAMRQLIGAALGKGSAGVSAPAELLAGVE
mgnify:CR=1 FL=1